MVKSKKSHNFFSVSVVTIFFSYVSSAFGELASTKQMHFTKKRHEQFLSKFLPVLENSPITQGYTLNISPAFTFSFANNLPFAAKIPSNAKSKEDVKNLRINYSIDRIREKRISSLALLFAYTHEVGHFLGKNSSSDALVVKECDADYFAASNYFSVLGDTLTDTANAELIKWNSKKFLNSKDFCNYFQSNNKFCTLALFIAEDAIRLADAKEISTQDFKSVFVLEYEDPEKDLFGHNGANCRYQSILRALMCSRLESDIILRGGSCKQTQCSTSP